MNQVSFSVNTTLTPYLDVKIFAACEGKNTSFNETNTCYGIGTKEINFKMQLTLNEDPPADKKFVSIFYNLFIA